MLRQRIRVRFAKQGDLRLISHRDLVRLFERLCRRANLALAMSAGFHPHPMMTFPAAMALGIEGRAEVADMTLAEPVDAEQIRARLACAAPAGLEIVSVRVLRPTERKATVRCADYELAVPPARWAATQAAVDRLRRQQVLCVRRRGLPTDIPLSESLDAIWLHEGRLGFRLHVTAPQPLRPREIVQHLGLDDLESQGFWLSRTRVDLVPAAS
jgi:radical SAM-linked protein